MASFDPRFDQLVEQTMKYWHVPGLSISIVNGHDITSKGYGFASFPNEKVTSKTLFMTASTTKAFTAAAISLLIDDTANSISPIKWTTPLSHLIREDFVLADEYATAHVTLEDALSHRTGMPAHSVSYGGNNATVRDLVRSLRYLPLSTELRTKFQYCNLMYTTVSHAMEAITGQWLGDFYKERIWHPLGMRNTFYSLKDARSFGPNSGAELAHAYSWNETKREFEGEPWIDMPEVSGAGLIISNVDDYAKWLRSMIHKLPPLSRDGHNAIITPRSLSEPEGKPPFKGPAMYAFGWNLLNYRGEQIIMHSGGTRGFGTIVLYLPGRQWGVTMMANCYIGSHSAQRKLAYYLVDEVLGTPHNQHFDWDRESEQEIKDKRLSLEHARERLYPNVPDPPLPLSLPLQAYKGTFTHPGYQSVTFDISDVQRLHADVAERTFAFIIDMEHVSGEHFIAQVRAKWLGLDGATATKAEFGIDVTGKATRFGIEIEPGMEGQKIWFEKVGE